MNKGQLSQGDTRNGANAIRRHSESSRATSEQRPLTDIDFIGLAKDKDKIEKMFTELGYTSVTMFNALQGHERLKFLKEDLKLTVDIFFRFHMCHSFDFSNRLNLSSSTLTPSDLLITKLQIVQQNEKDVRDIVALVTDHDL